ncbi:MAG: cardiolipin synthase [Spirochaetes bacterium]|nr:cardiolipin synthase [Spirochaetota bacterium]
MIKIPWIIINIMPLLGLLLAFILIILLLNERRAPSSTIAWLLAIIFLPYISVPLYIIFGGRKMKHMIKKKENLKKIDNSINLSNHKNHEKLSSMYNNLFPVRYNNDVKVLETGEKAFEYLINLIKNAKKNIYITTFILGKDETGEYLINTLIEKIKEGLEVCLLLDALGSMNISKKFLSDYKKAGGKYAFFMPMIHIPFRGRANLRNHRKIVIIDNKTAIVGGMNIAKEFLGNSDYQKRWLDLSLAVEGPIVYDLYHVFYSDWKFASHKDLSYPADDLFSKEENDEIPLHLIPSGPDVVGDTLHDTIITAIFEAKKRIWIVTPYFIPDDMLIKALCIASARNVDVRLIIPLASNHKLADIVRKNYLIQLQDAQIKIYNYKPGMIHAKILIIDETYSIIGSANMDIRSLFLNYEIALFIYSKKILNQLENWISEISKNCNIGVKKSNFIFGFFERILRLLAPLL